MAPWDKLPLVSVPYATKEKRVVSEWPLMLHTHHRPVGDDTVRRGRRRSGFLKHWYMSKHQYCTKKSLWSQGTHPVWDSVPLGSAPVCFFKATVSKQSCSQTKEHFVVGENGSSGPEEWMCTVKLWVWSRFVVSEGPATHLPTLYGCLFVWCRGKRRCSIQFCTVAKLSCRCRGESKEQERCPQLFAGHPHQASKSASFLMTLEFWLFRRVCFFCEFLWDFAATCIFSWGGSQV